MNRSAATTWLTERYRELAVYAEFTTQQTTDAYNGAVDMSLRQMSVPESSLASYDVAQADVMKYLALLAYYALDRFSILLAIQFDVKAGQGAIEAARSQAFDRVAALKAMAAADLTKYGIGVGGVESMGMGYINLDYLEAASSSGGW